MHSTFETSFVFWTFLAFTLSSWCMGEPPQILTNSVDMKMVLIRKGEFIMGSPESEANRRWDEKAHKVTLSKDYYLCCFEVTQAQYRKVMGVNPSYFQGNTLKEQFDKVKSESGQISSDAWPVEMVNWENANEFCRKLSEIPEERAFKREYRLPTEAEWEYACRAATLTSYSFGDTSEMFVDYGWYVDNSNGMTHRVGSRKPNAWGLFDMHGNVDEWCADTMSIYPASHSIDPYVKLPNSTGIVRGGSWESLDFMCRSAVRVSFGQDEFCSSTGFRVALTPPSIAKLPKLMDGTVESTAEKTSGQSEAP